MENILTLSINKYNFDKTKTFLNLGLSKNISNVMIYTDSYASTISVHDNEDLIYQELNMDKNHYGFGFKKFLLEFDIELISDITKMNFDRIDFDLLENDKYEYELNINVMYRNILIKTFNIDNEKFLYLDKGIVGETWDIYKLQDIGDDEYKYIHNTLSFSDESLEELYECNTNPEIIDVFIDTSININDKKSIVMALQKSDEILFNECLLYSSNAHDLNNTIISLKTVLEKIRILGLNDSCMKLYINKYKNHIILKIDRGFNRCSLYIKVPKKNLNISFYLYKKYMNYKKDKKVDKIEQIINNENVEPYLLFELENDHYLSDDTFIDTTDDVNRCFVMRYNESIGLLFCSQYYKNKNLRNNNWNMINEKYGKDKMSKEYTFPIKDKNVSNRLKTCLDYFILLTDYKLEDLRFYLFMVDYNDSLKRIIIKSRRSTMVIILNITGVRI